MKAKKAGNTTITVCSKLNKKVKATCKITVKKKVVPTEKPTPTKKVTPIRKPTATPTKKPTATTAPRSTVTASPKPTATGKPMPTATPSPTLAPGDSYGELNSPVVDAEGNVTYSCVYFGNYPQSDAKGETREPIKWRVLYIQGDDALLVADQNLDVMKYNESYRDVTWETCTMRSWLNGYGSEVNVDGIDYESDNFIDRAFSAMEKSVILTANVVNKDNPEYGNIGALGGNDTQDKIFLLSMDEVSNGAYGFMSYKDDTQTSAGNEARKRTNTAYVTANGKMAWGEESDCWWLRSPGSDSYGAAYVGGSGNVIKYGSYGSNDYIAVCPALHLKLSSSEVWSVAESVTIGKGAESGDSYGELNSPVVDEEGNVTYSCVYFGNYPQSDATGETKEPIKWRVLYIQGEDAFLVADQNLDVMKYNQEFGSVTWETCTMRSWLNGYGSGFNADGVDYSSNNFIDRAFSATEKSAIITRNVVNKDNSRYATLGGNDTQDKIFLLSIEEISHSAYGFMPYKDDTQVYVNNKTRERTNTAYVAAKQNSNSYGEVESCWWLRSPGYRSDCASYIFDNGGVNWNGSSINYGNHAVCPALHLNLSSSNVWSVAESVTVER